MQTNFLSAHYYFDDETHSMDAFVLNKCDKEILQSIVIVAQTLKLEDDLKIEKLANEKGSLIEWYQALSYSDKVTTFALIVALMSYYYPRAPKKTHTEKQIDKLTQENLDLDNEKKKLEIAKLRKEINQGLEALDEKYKDVDNPDFSQDEQFEEVKKLALKLLQKNMKLRRSQASFYQKLVDYNKVQSVGFASYDKEKKPVSEEKVVERKDFEKFLLDTDQDVEIREDVKIIITSPNLQPMRNKWRGYLVDDDVNIQFSMSDTDFKSSVNSGDINFANGSTIYAVLIVTTKFDEFGDETSKKYEVETVLKYSAGTKSIETKQGKQFKFNKKQLESQQEFDFLDE